MAYHGYRPIQADEDFTLPDATSSYSDDFRYYGKTNGRERLLIIAQNAVEIATGQAFNIEFCYGSAANPTTGPDDAHIYLLHKTSADDELTYAAGAVMVDFTLPEELLTADDYWRVKFTATETETADIVDILHVGQV
jgi:hypothetical protein